MVEVELVEQLFTHEQLSLQELSVHFVGLDMGVDGFNLVLEDLLLIYFEEIEGNIVGIVLDGGGEEIDIKLNFRILQEKQA